MATRKKTAAPAAAPAADLIAESAPDAAPEAAPVAARVRAPSLKIKDLLARVGTASGAKKKDLKPIVEATLRELGEALSRGEELNLPGFGRSRVAKSAQKDGASHLTLKLKRGAHKKREHDDNEPLAEDGEDS